MIVASGGIRGFLWRGIAFALGLVLWLALAMGCGSDSAVNAPDAGDADGSTPPQGDDDAGAPETGASIANGDAAHDQDGAVDSGAAPAPVLASINPSSVTLGSTATTIIAQGGGFVPRSVVQLDGAPLITSFVSATELRATVPASSFITLQSLHVTVGTAPPGGGASGSLLLDVVNPTPAITALSPSSVVVGAADTTLAITGTSFVNGATVSFDGTSLTVRSVSTTNILATIPAAKLATSGSFSVTVTNPSPGGGTSSSIAFTVTNPNVSIASVSPSSAHVGDSATTIQITGNGFLAASSVSFNGATLTSTTADAQHVSATVPANQLANAGDFPVVVTNPAPGGGVSTPAIFHVVYAAPTATSLSPSSALVGTAPPTITVTGAGFLSGKTQIAFDGSTAATNVADGSHASATLTTQQMSGARTIQVTVVNPAPGGGASSALAFEVRNPVPVATSLLPPSVGAGAGDTTITVSGSGFVDGAGTAAHGSVVYAGATALVTAFVNAQSLSATVPASMLSTANAIAITVANPAPGGGSSDPLTFSATNPGPTLTGVSPSWAIVPAQDTTVTLSGTGFVNGNGVAANGSRAMIGQTTLPTTFVSSATLRATIPAASLATAATISLRIVNPQPGGGTSGSVYFNADNPLPTLSSVSPSQLTFGAGDTTLTLTGTGFVAGSVVKASNTTLASTTHSATQITATLPAAQLTTVGNLSLTVTNAAPGGGTSAAQTITIACDSTGVGYPLSTLNQPTSIALSFSGSNVPSAYRIIQSTATGADMCPGIADTAYVEPYRAFVVQNVTPQTATLTAWAVCSSSLNDAFLTFYGGGSLPSDLEQCTGYVAEGSAGSNSGSVKHTSPESNGASFCPGLVGGDGLSLATCGRAVVFMQQYSSSLSTPSTLKIQIQ